MRVLIVDDERLARQRLRAGLATIEGASVAGEANDADAAVRANERLKPDVVLLDIEMPGGTGLFVARRIANAAHVPEIVFVTAFDHYAVDAFAHDAADYLTKPVEFGRLGEALNRAKERLRLRSADERASCLAARAIALEAAGHETARQTAPGDLWLTLAGTRVKVSTHDITVVAADRDYVRITTTTGVLHHRSTIKAMIHVLGEDFIRIHRSYVVRCAAISAFRRCGYRRHEVDVHGVGLPVGASFVPAVEALIARSKAC